VEYIHDKLVAERMPFDEPIDPHAFRDLDGLDSAVNRPFHTFDGQDLHPTLAHKAAALFHSLACNHSFLNGNKRTAVMALDMFLTANERCLLINNDDVYQLAKGTVMAHQQGIELDVLLRELTNRIETESIDFEILLDPDLAKQMPQLPRVHAAMEVVKEAIRSHPLNEAVNTCLE